MTASNSSNDIKIIRVYDAPLKTVWDAWTDSKQVAQWWGPRGFTLKTHHKDLRTGGAWHYTMFGPDGTEYENTTKYLEVVDQAKLVYDHGGHADRPPLFRVTVLFSEVGRGKTRMEMTSTLPTAEAAAEMRIFIKKAGGESTWDRLAEYLEKNASGVENFVIARAFDIPMEQMFDLWTNPKHLPHWLPPAGFTMEFLEADIRPGGSSFYVMSGPGGAKLYGISNYIAIDRPTRVAFTQQFADANRRIVRAPFSGHWPETMLTTVDFCEEGRDRTRVIVTSKVIDSFTKEELETFVQARASMTQGWSGSFDKLESYVRQA